MISRSCPIVLLSLIAGCPPPIAPPEGPECAPLTIGDVGLDVQFDVETVYSAPIAEELGTDVPDFLVFNFVNFNERFGQLALGTFSLADAPNDNRATCPECITVFVDQLTPNSPPASTFFQRAGTIVVERDPRQLQFFARVEGLVLEEVTIEPGTFVSTPVEGGGCFSIAPFEVALKIVPDAWTCPEENYGEGDGCQCDCGVIDTDCFCDPFANPDCPAVIEDDCPVGEVCTADGCQTSCSAIAPTVGCAQGELCAFDFGGDICVDITGRTDPAALGEACQDSGPLVRYCAVDETLPGGLCDDFDGTCRALCRLSSGCPAGETCFTVNGGPDGEQSGYCRPEGPRGGPPEEWFCVEQSYGEGIACDCDCGAVDPDCLSGELQVEGCNAGETCVDGLCE